MSCSRLFSFIILFILSGHTLYAQDKPIGQWQSHLPYNTAVSIATDGVTMFVATQTGFYALSIAGGEITKYSKVNGMSDQGMSKIGYDKTTGTVVLTYQDGNIDLFRDGNFYNIPDLKLKTVTGSKTINDVYTEGGLAYLSTDVGIIVLNLMSDEVKETYTFSKNGEILSVKRMAAGENYFYAATNKGLYKALKSSPKLQSFQEAWVPLDSTRNFTGLAVLDQNLFASISDSLFVMDYDTLRTLYTTDDSVIINLQEGIGSVWVMEYNDSTFLGKALRMNMDFLFTDSLNTLGNAYELIDYPDADSSKWIANVDKGLKRRTQKGETFNTLPPNGPDGIANYDIYANNRHLVVAHGGYDDTYRPLNITSGFSVYKDDEWKSYRLYEYPPFGDSVRDITHVLIGPKNEIYAGSTQSGLFILNEDGSYEYYKQNSFIDPSVTGSTLYRISGIAFDNDGVLWLSVFGGKPHQLVARTKDGKWTPINVPSNSTIDNAAINLTIDDYNQKWFAVPGGGGVMVYDDNHTPDVTIDDRHIQLLSGKGSGGLPTNDVYCIANDKNGSVWIGTSDGIGIVNCPSQVIDRQCEAEKRIVQYDQFAGYLFQNEHVNTIAVDGGNRKWVGTNNGVWQVSSNGDEILERFTADNSPLPSNIIQKITVDPVTGDVYIGTEKGLMSYRGKAVDGGKQNSELIAYPNPVPSGYSGTIAIKGFVENADVRITDISGQLVYKTTALGGQAVWNGLDYTGRRPQSGVYLIFGTNKDGSETVKGKLVFME